MKLRTFALTAVALISLGAFAAGSACAQDAPQRPNRANRQAGAQGNRQAGRAGLAQNVAAAFKAVSPTTDQEARFKSLQESYRKDMMALRDVAREERRDKTQAINTKFQSDVVALLTEEQKPKYQEAFRKAQQRRGGLMNALEPLKLTEDQKKSIQPIIRDTQRQMMEVSRNQAVPQTERASKVAGILDEFKGKVRPLLTAEQQKDFDALDLRRATQGGRQNRQRGAGAPPPRVL